MKSPFQRIVGYNLAIFFVVTTVVSIGAQINDTGSALLPALLAGIQILVNVSQALSNGTLEAKRAYWLSALLLSLIGLGVCAAQILA